jgi:uncharacterized membrane protein
MVGGIPMNLDIPPPMSKTYFFSGAGAGVVVVVVVVFCCSVVVFSGAALSGAVVVVVVFVSSFTAAGFSCEGPQPTNAKLARNVIAIKSTNSFFIICHLLSLVNVNSIFYGYTTMLKPYQVNS